MRAFTAIISTRLLVVFSLLLLVGCAQNSYSVKDTGLNSAEMATLLDISLSGEGDAEKVGITADRPLTFTYYSLRDPFRTVIDLSQADTGSVQVPSIATSAKIKSISVDKSEMTAGSLVRITIETFDETEFSVTHDSSDARRLVVAPAVEVEKKDSSTGEKASLQASVAQNTAIPAETSESHSLVSKTTPSQAILTGLEIVDTGIEIVATGDVEKFNSFTLSKPQRLVVDFFDVKSTISRSAIPLKKYGVENARIGIYPEKVRIVFDSNRSVFPKYELEKSDRGMLLAMGTHKQSDKITASQESHDPGVKGTGTSKVPSRMEAIDFSIVDGYSRVVMTLSGDFHHEQPQRTTEGLAITFPGCIVPKRLQRPFDSSAFASSVSKVTPYQTKVRGRFDTKVLIALREDMPYTVKKVGNTVVLDIKNPEQTPGKALTTAKTGELSVNARRTDEVNGKPPQTVARHNEEHKKDHSLYPGSERRGEKKIYTGKRVTLEFADADIRKIFQLIAEVSNKNILVGDDVTGTISIKLVNVPWDQALDVILQTKGLDKKEDGNIMIIRPAGKMASIADEELSARRAFERTLEIRTRVFDINFASVSDIAGQFNSYKSERGTITIDSRTNKVIVNDIVPAIEKMSALLKELDIPEKQVLIEARIVEATSSFTRDLGIQWGIHHRDGSASFLGINSLDTGFGGIITNIPPTSGFQSAASAGGAMGLSFGKLTNNIQIDLRISAAAEVGQVKIISTPKVVTLNNKAAKIAQGVMQPYSTVSAEGTKTEFVEAALTLEVTPHITASGAVSMKIKASNNSLGGAAAGVAPPINKKEATTELLVQNGETTVIGGIYVDTDSVTDSGVPFLMDIPLLGWLFKSNNQKKTKSELLIFITPKIVS